MANPYFTRPASVVPGTTVRADKYNSDLDVSESAFNALHEKLEQALFLPSTFSGNPVIPEQTVENTFIYIDASGNIALYPIQTFLDAFAVVEAQYNQISAWQVQVADNAVQAQDSALLSQKFANNDEDIEVLNGLYSSKHWSKKAEAQLSIVQAAGQVKVDEAQARVDLAQQAVIAAQGEVSNAQSKADIASGHATNAAESATQSDNFANFAHNQLVPNSGGKYSSYHWAKEAESYAQQTLSTVNGDFVPNTRTVNGKSLDANITINGADIPGLATVALTGNYASLTGIPSTIVHDGDYGLGASGATHYHGGADLNVVDDTRIFLAQDAGPAAWPSGGTYFYPMGFNLHRSSIVRGQVAQGWSASFGAVIKHRAGNSEGTGFQDWQTVWDDLNLPNPVQTTDLASVATSGDYADLSNKPTVSSLGAVPTSRTVNGKALTSNITLNAADVGALPSSTTLASLGGVPTSRQVNGKALTGNITLTSSDVGAIPNTQKGSAVTRVSGSFTATKNAGINEYFTSATTNSTCTINSSAFAANDELIIHKQRSSGQLSLTSGVNMILPDGTSATSHHIRDGVACTVKMVFTGTTAELRIY